MKVSRRHVSYMYLTAVAFLHNRRNRLTLKQPTSLAELSLLIIIIIIVALEMRGFRLRVAIGCNSKPLSRVPIGLGAVQQQCFDPSSQWLHSANTHSSVLNSVSFFCVYLPHHVVVFRLHRLVSAKPARCVHYQISISLCGASSSLARDVFWDWHPRLTLLVSALAIAFNPIFWK